MTEYYDVEEMNTNIQWPYDSEPRLSYYFDFDTKRWRMVKPMNRLMHNLCTYFYIDEEFGDVLYDDNCIVTCLDSYRLSENPALEPPVDQLFAEKAWRDKITKGSEFDHNREAREWSHAGVIRVDDLIIPGVIVGIDASRSDSFTYYKESRNIRRPKEKITRDVTKIRQIISLCTWSKHPEFLFHDIRHYYRTLKIYPEPITKNLLDKKVPGCTCFVHPSIITIAALVSFAEKYDACFYETQLKVKDGECIFPQESFIFDIVVHGGTYANLSCKNQIVGTLDGINIDNPLFLFGCNPCFKVITDGNRVEFKVGMLQINSLDVFNTLCNQYQANFIQDNVFLLSSHYGEPCHVFPSSELT